MSEVISFNTEDAVKDGFSDIRPIDIFALVGENDPILNSVAPEFDFENPPVDPNEFASRLVETCKFRGGFGLAANQCGYNHRVFVMGSGNEYVGLFNPKIINQSDEHSLVAEGCLSFPMLALKISRPKSIEVEYYDFRGEKHETKFEGLTAHVFQHELDHLNGICYTDRAKPMALKTGLKKRDKYTKLVERYENAQKKLNSVM
jgi:peptide deformylase